MSTSLQIGPLALPYALLLFVAAVAVSFQLGKRLGKGSGAAVESLLGQTLIAGLVVSRLAFVLRFASDYLASPLSILDIRDGGWSPLAGLIGAAVFAWARLRRLPACRKALWSAFAAGAAIWAAGTLLLSTLAANGQQLPALTLSSLNGEPVQLARFSGRPAVVNLWATWCPPCVREMPVLQKAQLENPDVHFVFINHREPPERVRAWLAARGMTLRNVLLDQEGAAMTQFGQRGLPTTLIFNARGQLVSTRTGEFSAATLKDKLQPLRD